MKQDEISKKGVVCDFESKSGLRDYDFFDMSQDELKRRVIKLEIENKKLQEEIENLKEKNDVTLHDEEETKKELQEALAEARLANRSKNDFISRMSHDMRTPMNAILGFTTLGKMHSFDHRYVKESFEKIEFSSKQLLELINDILDMNKIEQGLIDNKDTSFNIYQLFKETTLQMHEEIVEHGLSLTRSFSGIVHPYLIGNQTIIKKIILQILSNAIKFNKKYGSITITADEIEYDEENAKIEVKIIDTGRGMSSEYIEHIFEPFSQDVSNARTNYVGAGLGMTIVKKLMDLVGGEISVQSELGKGTTFDLIFNLKVDKNIKNNLLEDTHQTIAITDITGVKILLVEDNELNAEIAIQLLEECGAKVEWGENGKIGLDMFIDSPLNYYNCILMDLRMPIMDGIEATKCIRALDRVDAMYTPIFAMTADAFQDDEIKVKEAGMNEHLTKPMDLEKVTKIISKYCLKRKINK